MRSFRDNLQPVFTAILRTFAGSAVCAVTLCTSLKADGRVDLLIEELQEAEPARAAQIIRDVEREWSLSGSTSVDLIYRRGKDALDDGNWNLAIEHLTAVTDHAPEFAEAWHARATAFWRKGQFGPALDDLGTALRLNPRQWDALFGMGVLFQELGEYNRAERAFRMALDLNPHHENAEEALKQIKRFGVGQEL